MNTATELIYTDLDAVYGSDDGLKRKLTFFDLSGKMLEPTNYETYYSLHT